MLALCSAAVLAGGAPAARAQSAPEPAVAGSIDPTFGSGGFSTVAVGTWAGAVSAVIQSDHKVVSAGQAEIDGTNVIVVTRMNANGSLDSSFGHGGVVIVNPGGGAGMDSGAGMMLQGDGKILLAGSIRYNQTGPLAFAAVRLLPSGALDPAFGSGGIAEVPIGNEAIANAVAIQPDGKIVLGGTALLVHNQFAAVRLNSDGSLDTSFGNGGITTLPPNGGAWGMVLQPNGDIVLGGEQDGVVTRNFMVARLLPDGSADPAFGSRGVLPIAIGTSSLATAVALEPDGSILLAGGAFVSNKNVGAAARLLPDGSFDPSFGSNGVATFPDQTVNAVALDAKDRIVLAGVGETVGRLEPSGSVDRSFGLNGIAHAAAGTNDAANGLAIDPDSGDILLGGVSTISGQLELSVARLTGDPPTQATSGASSPVTAAATPSPRRQLSVHASTTGTQTTTVRTPRRRHHHRRHRHRRHPAQHRRRSAPHRRR